MWNITQPQNRFNRSQRDIKPIILPERLQRLNREIGLNKEKTFDYVYLVRQGLRVRVCVMVDEDGRFYATAQVGQRAFRLQGGSPSGALWMLSIKMNVFLASLPSRDRVRLTGGVR